MTNRLTIDAFTSLQRYEHALALLVDALGSGTPSPHAALRSHFGYQFPVCRDGEDDFSLKLVCGLLDWSHLSASHEHTSSGLCVLNGIDDNLCAVPRTS